MAATRSIELRTEIPGPRSREILERKERVVADPLEIYLPIVDRRGRAARRSPTSTATRSSTSRAASAASTSATPTRASSRPSGAGGALPAHRLHDRPLRVYVELAERLIALAPFTGPAKAAFFNAGTEAVENAVKFARALHGPPRGDRLRGRLPRAHAALAHAHLEDAPVQGGPRPVRARGLPRAVPERLPRVPPRDALAALERAFVDAGRRRAGRRDRRRAGAGRGRLLVPPAGVHARACAGSATSTASCSSSTRCRPASAAPASCSRSSTTASSPT